MLSRYDISIAGQTYILKPGTFAEGSVRRQAEVYTLQDTDFKSRPDMREFWQTSWLGGARWEKPVYNLQSLDTYYHANNLSFTDRGGAAREPREVTQLSISTGVLSNKLIPWHRNGTRGAVCLKVETTNHRFMKWNGTAFVNGSDAFAMAASPAAATGGNTNYVYVLYDNGTLARWDTSVGTVDTYATGMTVYPGAALWVAEAKVWCYNGDQVYSLASADLFVAEVEANDGLGKDVLADITSSATDIIPPWTTPRALPTAEGVYYIKNVYDGAQSFAKLYRVDRDATGVYINTPVATLSPDVVAVSLDYHLSSIIIGTVENRWAALANIAHQRVTYYHVTGGSVGAIGSPLGGDALTDTPVWLLGSVGDQLYIGGKRSIWTYDARIGSIHPLYSIAGIGDSNPWGGWHTMVSVQIGADGASVPGNMIMHSSTTGTNPAHVLLQRIGSSRNGLSQSNYVESNWIDFDLPMEQKTITELYYDAENVRAAATVAIQLKADNGSFTTVHTITGGVSPNTARVALATPLKGYKFQYKLVFSDSAGSATVPTDILALGFSAAAGEMVKVLQFTIDGTESVNIENKVQIPYNVYTALATLRDNEDAVTVRHWMVSDQGNDFVEGSYKVISVTANKAMPSEGFYDVVLMGN